MDHDGSEGYESIADDFVAARSDIGADVIRAWSRRHIPDAGSVLDIGCGSGLPITQAVVNEGFNAYGVDAAASLVQKFRTNLPQTPIACERFQDSDFFHRQFDAIISIGLIFLLKPDDQALLIRKSSAALTSGGRMIFSAPKQICEWTDILSGRRSRSLGEIAYATLIADADMTLVKCLADDWDNNYFDISKP